MSQTGLQLFLEENFSAHDLVVVSNREPYVHRKTDTGIKMDKPAGGLASAMDDVLKATGGV